MLEHIPTARRAIKRVIDETDRSLTSNWKYWVHVKIPM